MSSILDKFGVYDLIAVLLSGISIFTLSILVLNLVYGVTLDKAISVNETLSFLVLSYFLGLTFQEIGSIILKRILYRGNRLLESAISSKNKTHVHLSDEELNSVNEYIRKRLSKCSNEDTVMYNFCKYYVLENCDTTQIDKDQSLSAMSRSLSLFFFILTIAALLSLFHQFNGKRVALAIFSMFSTILFFQRCVRFAKMRYAKIYRMFLYKEVVIQSEKDSTQNKVNT